MSLRVVLTGGIASGKTAVAGEFIALGIVVIDTDQISREVVAPGTAGLAKIVEAFGNGVLDGSGHLDRARMRELVFSDREKLLQLEAITHPAIREELAKRSTAAAGPYQLHAIPLFVEKGAKGSYDRVLVVDCPVELQLIRLMRRDGTEAPIGRKILASQASRAERLAAADDVIVNDGTLDALRVQVLALHVQYLRLAAAKAGVRDI